MLTITQSKLKMTLSALFITTLTACGGGGSNGSASTTQSTTPTPITPDPTPAQQMEAQFGLYLTDLANNHILPSYQQLANNEIKLKH
jgi:hypothetical protein